MEVSGLRLLFLIALAATTLPGCALFRRGAPAGAEPVAQAGEPVQQAAPSPVTGEPSIRRRVPPPSLSRLTPSTWVPEATSSAGSATTR